MKHLLQVGFAFASLATLMTSAVAAGPVTGTWHGRISFDTSKLPPISDASQKKLMMSQVQAAEQVKLTLNMNPNHTLTMVAIGGPKAQPNVSGTWSQAGNTVSLTIKPSNPRVPAKAKQFVLSPDTKTFTYTEGALRMRFMR